MRKKLLFALFGALALLCLAHSPTYSQADCPKKLKKADWKSFGKAYAYMKNKKYELASTEICKIEKAKKSREKLIDDGWEKYKVLYNWVKANLYVYHYEEHEENVHNAIHHAGKARDVYRKKYKGTKAKDALWLKEEGVTDKTMQAFIDELNKPEPEPEPEEPKCAAVNTPCDDKDPYTQNDVEDGNCNCKGTVSDLDKVTTQIKEKKEEVKEEVKNDIKKKVKPTTATKPKKSTKESTETADDSKPFEEENIPEPLLIDVPDCAEDLAPLDLRVVFEYTDNGDGVKTVAALEKNEYINRYVKKALDVLQKSIDKQYEDLETSRKIRGFVTGYATNKPVPNLLNISGKYLNGLFYQKDFGEIPSTTYESIDSRGSAKITYDGGKYSSIIESQEELAFMRAYGVMYRLSKKSPNIDMENLQIITSIVDTEDDGGKVQINLDVENAFDIYLKDLSSEVREEFIEETKKKCIALNEQEKKEKADTEKDIVEDMEKE